MPFDPKQTIKDAKLFQDGESEFNLDFRDDANLNQDWEGMSLDFGAVAAKKWGRDARGGGFTNDAELGHVSECALRSVIQGFYLKKPRKTHWSDGSYITLTDRGSHPGAKSIEYSTAGGRYHTNDDGITADNQSPETSVTVAEDLTEQRFVKVATKVEVTWQEIQEANMRGFDAMERKGELLRQEHAFNLNNLIRRGNATHGLTGIVNHPGIRRRVATTDWGGSLPADIYDEYIAAISQIYGAATEEDIPQHSVLPRIQHNYFATEQFSTATDTKLKAFIESAYADEQVPHKIIPDNGMSQAGRLGDPAALFYSNDPALVVCTMPYYMRLMAPYDEDRYVISMEIISRFAGVQVFDTDTVLVVDGGTANWEQPANANY
jgi:hypothetical protein